MRWWQKNWELLNGCSEISPACENCFARNYIRRFESRQEKWQGLLNDGGSWNSTVKLCPENLDLPLKTKKPTVWFVTERGDLFHEKVPDDFIERAYAVMAKAHRHTFLVLTKRAERMAEFMSSMPIRHLIDSDERLWGGQLWEMGESFEWPLPNVWHAVTAENQEQADKRIPELLKVPGKRFLSVEPLLSPLDLTMALEDFQPYNPDLSRKVAPIHAVIVGGESGPCARPTHPGWVRAIARQCWHDGIAFTFKQMGEWKHNSICTEADFKAPEQYTKDGTYFRVGTKRNGHLLDGKEYIDLPWRTL